jgi:murein tripeptide amidase MpaA
VFYNNEWQRGKVKTLYFRNNILKEFTTHYYYTLSFLYSFENEGKVFFAANYPYTYTHLNSFLKCVITSHPDVIVKRRLCQTLAMNDCDYVTITSKKHSADKKGVMIIARQHPGEVTSSFVAEGIIEFLVSSHPEA